MIVKTRKDKNGKQIYTNAITGQEGLIDQIAVSPSQRRGKRNFQSAIQKVRTNRKATLGRNVYYQHIYKIEDVFNGFNTVRNTDTGEIIKVERLTTKKPVLKKTIKHIQETPNAIRRKTSHFNLLERIELNKSKWHKAHPEYQRKEAI